MLRIELVYLLPCVVPCSSLVVDVLDHIALDGVVLGGIAVETVKAGLIRK